MPDQSARDLALIRRYRRDAEPLLDLARPVAGPALPRLFPGRRRIPLPWPGPGGAGTAEPGGGREAVGRLLLGFGAVRYRYQAAEGGYPGWADLGRPVPSGGAYYPGELYLCWPGSDDLPAGVYHHDPLHHALDELSLTDRAGHAYVLSCRVWKNAQKYGNLGYRLGCLDLGAMVGQLLAFGPDGGRVSFLFDQSAWDAALGLPSDLETVYAVVHPYRRAEPPPAIPAGSPAGECALDRELAGLVREETRALHRASATLRGAPPAAAATVDRPARRPATPFARRSAAAFRPGALPAEEVVEVLSAAASEVPGDLPAGDVSLYCVAADVAGTAPGAYRYEPAGRQLVRCGARDALARLAATVCGYPDPVLVGAANVFVTGDYREGAAIVGPRWYRVLNLLAGVVVQRLYLAAAALGLAARARLGYHAPAVDSLLGLPGERTALVQVALGRPAPRSGHLELMLL